MKTYILVENSDYDDTKLFYIETDSLKKAKVKVLEYLIENDPDNIIWDSITEDNNLELFESDNITKL